MSNVIELPINRARQVAMVMEELIPDPCNRAKVIAAVFASLPPSVRASVAKVINRAQSDGEPQ